MIGRKRETEDNKYEMDIGKEVDRIRREEGKEG